MQENNNVQEEPTVANKDFPARFLRETEYLDFSHPALQTLIRRVREDHDDERARAVALHNHVRDNVRFGFTSAFYDMKASQVLLSRQGFCNPKATLLTALLRGAGIPARQRFFGLSSQVLNGLINPGSDYVDHAVVEVWLEERWIRTDSYIIDAELFQAGVLAHTDVLGFGVRRDGGTEWDGETDCFAQFHPDFVARDFGTYDDVGRFYRDAPKPYNRSSWVTRLLSRPATTRANIRISELRNRATVAA
ncbi:MAG: transglutaminase-like domain-containing protein [Pseudomonadota bacterium]